MTSLAMNKYFLSPDAGGGRYRVAGIERAIRSFQWGLAQRYPFPSPPLASALLWHPSVTNLNLTR